MISFRLTAEEYDRFHELCATCGTRSVSELARAAINALLKQPAHAPSEAIESRVTELEGRVNILRSEFMKLRRQEAGQTPDATKVDPPDGCLTDQTIFDITGSRKPNVFR